MSDPRLHVTLHADVTAYLRAMRRAHRVLAWRRFTARIRRWFRR